MRCKSLQDNAPGETRTPNLLIRSQFRMEHLPPGTVLREWLAKQEAAKQGPKADNGSHNNSHNASPVRSFRVPKARENQEQLQERF